MGQKVDMANLYSIGADLSSRPLVEVQCRECDGTGEWWRLPTSVSEAAYHGDSVYIGPCEYCDGTGWVDRPADRLCPQCGWYGLDSPEDFCPRCGVEGLQKW